MSYLYLFAFCNPRDFISLSEQVHIVNVRNLNLEAEWIVRQNVFLLKHIYKCWCHIEIKLRFSNMCDLKISLCDFLQKQNQASSKPNSWQSYVVCGNSRDPTYRSFTSSRAWHAGVSSWLTESSRNTTKRIQGQCSISTHNIHKSQGRCKARFLLQCLSNFHKERILF